MPCPDLPSCHTVLVAACHTRPSHHHACLRLPARFPIWRVQVPPTPPVDPENEEFVIFVRSTKVREGAHLEGGRREARSGHMGWRAAPAPRCAVPCRAMLRAYVAYCMAPVPCTLLARFKCLRVPVCWRVAALRGCNRPVGCNARRHVSAVRVRELRGMVAQGAAGRRAW